MQRSIFKSNANIIIIIVIKITRKSYDFMCIYINVKGDDHNQEYSSNGSSCVVVIVVEKFSDLIRNRRISS